VISSPPVEAQSPVELWASLQRPGGLVGPDPPAARRCEGSSTCRSGFCSVGDTRAYPSWCARPGTYRKRPERRGRHVSYGRQLWDTSTWAVTCSGRWRSSRSATWPAAGACSRAVVVRDRRSVREVVWVKHGPVPVLVRVRRYVRAVPDQLGSRLARTAMVGVAALIVARQRCCVGGVSSMTFHGGHGGWASYRQSSSRRGVAGWPGAIPDRPGWRAGTPRPPSGTATWSPPGGRSAPGRRRGPGRWSLPRSGAA